MLAAFALLASGPGLPLFTPDQASAYSVFLGNAETKEGDPRARWENEGWTFLDVPLEGAKTDFGYLSTREALRNYRLSLEYQWGTKRFPPRENNLRDSGLLYHLTGADRVWPDCVEFQIQEGEVGDVFLIGNGIKADSLSKDGKTFDPSGSSRSVEGTSYRRGKTADTLTGWNTVELTARDAEAIYRVNGQENNHLTNLRRADGKPVDEGRIALQLEGAEIRYRNVRIAPLSWPERHDPFRVLVFSKTTGFRHDSIPTGIAALRQLGKEFGFDVDATEDASNFTPDQLKPYRAVVFLSTTDDVLNDAQQKAFEGYIRGGGGFVGIHAASDTEYDWPWYGQLVGAYFARHPQIQPATVRLRNDSTPSTGSLPRVWERTDEWYAFRKPPEGVEILAEVGETKTDAEAIPAHPIAWQHAFDGGRAWYTGMGHTKESYASPPFLLHILGGIQYAAGL